MKKANLPWLFSAKPRTLFIFNIFLIIVLVISLVKPTTVQSALAGHIVISEVQLAGTATTDDFVELYNPTNSAINLDDLTLVKRTSSGTTDDSLTTFTASDIIPAHGYFLWCNNALDASLSCDKNTADSIANNNSVALRSGTLDSGPIVDSVTFGTVQHPLGEGTALTAPPQNSSVERKANSSSTQSSMLASDANGGNGEDTNDNSADFVLRDLSQPQNSSSSAETPTASPNPSASESASPSASASASASPSSSPSASPSPSASASATPTATPSTSPSPSATASASPSASATPSATPTASPSASASPSSSPSATPTASPSVSPSHKPHPSPKPHKQFVCKFEPLTINFGHFHFTFHILNCDWIRI